jgi:hypothetical protein
VKTRINPWLLLLGFSLSGSLALPQTPNCGCEAKPQLNVLAVVNGTRITQQDLSIDTRTQVSLAQETVITARNQQLILQINKMLLEAEAKRRGTTEARLFEMEVTALVRPPTEAEARVIYEQNKDRFGQSFGRVKNDIIARLKSEREVARAAEFVNMLRSRARVSIANQQVTPPTTEADLERVFATVNDVKITSRDIEQSLLPLIFNVQRQVYALRKRDVDIRINDLLLHEEAKRLGISPELLLDRTVISQVPIVTLEQAQAYYNQHKASLKGDFSKLKNGIMQLLLEQEKQKVVAAFAEQLRKAAAVQIYLTEPRPTNVRQLCCNPVD